jgi:hypothetical protein
MKIAFKDVGRGKANWTAEIDTTKPADDVHLNFLMEVDRNGGLISRGIEVSYDDEFNGKIYAGFHMVGTFAPEAA